MDIRETLISAHSKQVTNAVIAYVGNDSKRFKELYKLFLSSESLVAQRAAWPLSYIVIQFPELIRPHFASLVVYLQEKGHHQAIYRNAFRFLQFISIPEKFESEIYDLAIHYCRDMNTPVAIQAFAMSTAARIAGKYPELAEELVQILEMNYPLAAGGFKARAKQVMKELMKRISQLR